MKRKRIRLIFLSYFPVQCSQILVNISRRLRTQAISARQGESTAEWARGGGRTREAVLVRHSQAQNGRVRLANGENLRQPEHPRRPDRRCGRKRGLQAQSNDSTTHPHTHVKKGVKSFFAIPPPCAIVLSVRSAKPASPKPDDIGVPKLFNAIGLFVEESPKVRKSHLSLHFNSATLKRGAPTSPRSPPLSVALLCAAP